MLSIHRILIAYAVAVPLALALGYMVATPDLANIAAIAFVLFCLALPLVIRWHHALLIVCWNSAFMLGFVPGQPRLWLLLAGLAFAVAAVNHVTGLKPFLRAPELTKPILFFLVVILVTARLRGGLGSRVLGGTGYGGKNYIFLLAAIIGYFALTAQRIPIAKSQRMVKWFFLSSWTFVLSNLIFALGPAFYVLYNVISSEVVGSQVAVEYGQGGVERFDGMGPAATGLLCFILARWGIRGTLEWSKPWRLCIFAVALVAGLFSGFRSQIGFLGILFLVQFVIEGLWKTALTPLFFLVGALCLTPMLIFAPKLPEAVQRSLAVFLPILPVNIDPTVRLDAVNSSEWRVEMWKAVLPDVPKYLLLGKGYSLDPVDLYLTSEATRSGVLPSYDLSIVAGDYHNGPLSVIIPFGIFGAIAVLWLMAAGVKVLYWNSRYGDARLKLVNMALLSYFIALCLFFFFVVGAISSQLYVFLGILGLSVSLNGGVCRKPALARVTPPLSALAAPLVAA